MVKNPCAQTFLMKTICRRIKLYIAPAGNRTIAKRPVIITESIMRSSQIITMCQNLTGTSVAIRQGTKLARNIIEVTGMTASI